MKNIVLVLLVIPSLMGCTIRTHESNEERLGLLIIDAQKWYIPGHPESLYAQWNIKGHDRTSAAIIASMDSALTWANKRRLPVVVTYEGQNKGHYNLPDELIEDLDSTRTTHYIKFYYQATKHEEFKKIVQNSPVDHWILIGAETDVCVYQTAKGILNLGKRVTLVTEAIYSGLNNTEVSRSNLADFGAQFIHLKDLYTTEKFDHPSKVNVEAPLTLDNLVLTIYPYSDTSNMDSGASKRLAYLIQYAQIIGLKVEHPDSMSNTKQLRLLAGNISKAKYDALQKSSKNELMVISDCTPHMTFSAMPKEWRKQTLKILFYELMETVDFYYRSQAELCGWQKELRQAIDLEKLPYVESLQNE